jgi:hypothetical protein
MVAQIGGVDEQNHDHAKRASGNDVPFASARFLGRIVTGSAPLFPALTVCESM